jgi:cellobiose epimerase
MMKRLIALAAIAVFFLQANAQIQPDRLVSIADRLHVLGTKAMTFWKLHGVDPVYGGFLGTLDRNGTKTTPTYKGIVQEARHLWTFSMYYKRREATDSIKALADNLYNFITTYCINPADDRFYVTVTETGSPRTATHQLYMDDFAIYGLSQYALSFNNTAAVQYALKCFRSIDKSMHDSVYGGYNQTGEPWVLSGGAKETNTHMHIMETFTTLYEATRDTLVKSRLAEMVNVMINKIRQPQGYNANDFKLDWTPLSTGTVSFGHDLEAVWLLMEAARVLGIPDDSAIIAAAKAIGTLSAEKGWHAVKGGYFSKGQVTGKVTDSSKVWWIQAEALEGLWWMYKFTKDTTYFNRMEGTLSWIEQYQLNQTTGEWYATCNTSGSTLGSTNMGEEWKASYHTMRALMFAEDWIRASLPTGSIPGQVRGKSTQHIFLVNRVRGNIFRIESSFPGPCRIDVMTTAGRTVKSCVVSGRTCLLWKAGNAGVYLFRAAAVGSDMQTIRRTTVIAQ